MVAYFVVPLFLFLLVVVQSLLADVLFRGLCPLEISLIVVIYLARRVNLWRGVIICSYLGFLMDGVTGTVTGTYMFIYFLVFCISYFVSRHLYGEGDGFIMMLVFFWGVVEALFLLSFKSMFFGAFSLSGWWGLMFPQVIPLCVLGPFVFRLADRWGIVHGFNERSPERP